VLLLLLLSSSSLYEKLETSFRRCIDEEGRFCGDMSLLRRRHQILSRAVGMVDRFMMLSNVAGFVCHIANIILFVYSLIFYPESTFRNQAKTLPAKNFSTPFVTSRS